MFLKVSQKIATPLALICASAVLTACSSGKGSSRYNSADYQYEGVYQQNAYQGGAYQTQGLYQTMPAQTYGYSGAQVGVDGCGNVYASYPDCGGTTYQQPEPTPYQQPTPMAEPIITPPISTTSAVECPVGTTLNPDGQSCMMASDTFYTPPATVITHPTTPYIPPVYLPPRK
ncbi:MAG: hypothetical protein ACPGVT_02965 [Maricaulaceae bacterium]